MTGDEANRFLWSRVSEQRKWGSIVCRAFQGVFLIWGPLLYKGRLFAGGYCMVAWARRGNQDGDGNPKPRPNEILVLLL
jgi:hypothetical protein